jgi:hypothetical protein
VVIQGSVVDAVADYLAATYKLPKKYFQIKA